jgi:hypothetical protein
MPCILLKSSNVEFIAEIGSNWLGDVELAKKYVQKPFAMILNH